MDQLFGYAASVLLLLTLGAQLRQQWSRQSVEGVSPWLFAGQLAASVGFIVHSATIGSALFVGTNVLGSIAATVGIVMYAVLKRRETATSRGSAPATG